MELLKLIEFTKVLKQEREGDKTTIKMQQEMINKINCGKDKVERGEEVKQWNDP